MDRKILGELGEEKAVDYLLNKGWKILATNWRWRKAEIDIVGKEGDTLVFVEVKSRSSTSFGPPELNVSSRKVGLMREAMTAYMAEINHEWAVRIDVISVLLDPSGEHKIRHYEDSINIW